MKILLVNDDSISAPGLAALARAASDLGEVWVVAPAQQCSAMSMRLTLRDPIRVERAADFPVPVKGAYKVHGTPVDCVRVALRYILEEKPDYVFSGINNGYNVGYEIAYSGTLGAAFEATMHGIPAIAFSAGANMPLDGIQTSVATIAKGLLERPLAPGHVWNVNIPPQALGILENRTAAPCTLFQDSYVEEKLPDGAVSLAVRGTPLTAADPLPAGSDIEAVLKGFISIGTVKCAVL